MFLKFKWNLSRLRIAKAVLRKKNKARGTTQNSDNPVKLWLSKQLGTGTETDIWINEQNREPRNKPTYL